MMLDAPGSEALNLSAARGFTSVTDFVAQRVAAGRFSSNSMVVTLFGDVVSQHGDWVWLGSLIQALAPLGLAERRVRTAVYRLVQDDWLQVQKVGRKSYYAFTPSARSVYAKAAQRIYAARPTEASGAWSLVLPGFVVEPELAQFRKRLRWLGFNALANGVWAHPSIDNQFLQETIDELGLAGKVLVFHASIEDPASATTLTQLLKTRWQIDALDARYEQFCKVYRPIIACLQPAEATRNDSANFTPEQSFLLRVCLIHEYRRLLLKDYELPRNLLPAHWQGDAAQHLVRTAYQALAASSCEYIEATFVAQTGPLGRARTSFSRRFLQPRSSTPDDC